MKLEFEQEQYQAMIDELTGDAFADYVESEDKSEMAGIASEKKPEVQKLRENEKGKLEDRLHQLRKNPKKQDLAESLLVELTNGKLDSMPITEIYGKMGIVQKTTVDKTAEDEQILNPITYYNPEILLPDPFSSLTLDLHTYRVNDTFYLEMYASIRPRHEAKKDIPKIDDYLMRLSAENKDDFHNMHADESLLCFGFKRKSEDYMLLREDEVISLYRGCKGTKPATMIFEREFHNEMKNYITLLNKLLNQNSKDIETGPTYTVSLIPREQ